MSNWNHLSLSLSLWPVLWLHFDFFLLKIYSDCLSIWVSFGSLCLSRNMSTSPKIIQLIGAYLIYVCIHRSSWHTIVPMHLISAGSTVMSLFFFLNKFLLDYSCFAVSAFCCLHKRESIVCMCILPPFKSFFPFTLPEVCCSFSLYLLHS